MTAHRFLFKGGTEKVHDGTPQEQTYKFFLFSILEDREIIFYEAMKQGLIKKVPQRPDEVLEQRPSDAGMSDPYVSFSPEVKIFMNSQGFGVRRAYYSFFFRFDKTAANLITITPFGPNRGQFAFQARGRFMSTDEIKARYGETSQTYTYYCRQTYLSKTELQTHVTMGHIDQSSQQVRVLRF